MDIKRLPGGSGGGEGKADNARGGGDAGSQQPSESEKRPWPAKRVNVMSHRSKKCEPLPDEAPHWNCRTATAIGGAACGARLPVNDICVRCEMAPSEPRHAGQSRYDSMGWSNGEESPGMALMPVNTEAIRRSDGFLGRGPGASRGTRLFALLLVALVDAVGRFRGLAARVVASGDPSARIVHRQSAAPSSTDQVVATAVASVAAAAAVRAPAREGVPTAALCAALAGVQDGAVERCTANIWSTWPSATHFLVATHAIITPPATGAPHSSPGAAAAALFATTIGCPAGILPAFRTRPAPTSSDDSAAEFNWPAWCP
eukprot:scaffold26021_cov114-Isochrysis_galbana.AAC.2